jgi:hypothetical protein
MRGIGVSGRCIPGCLIKRLKGSFDVSFAQIRMLQVVLGGGEIGYCLNGVGYARYFTRNPDAVHGLCVLFA